MTTSLVSGTTDKTLDGPGQAGGAETLRATSFPDGFKAGAHNAVTTCLRIQPMEKVTLITDES